MYEMSVSVNYPDFESGGMKDFKGYVHRAYTECWGSVIPNITEITEGVLDLLLADETVACDIPGIPVSPLGIENLVGLFLMEYNYNYLDEYGNEQNSAQPPMFPELEENYLYGRTGNRCNSLPLCGAGLL